MAAPIQYEVLAAHSTPPVLVAPPEHPTPVPQIIEALRTIAALDGLTDDEYRWIAEHGNEMVGRDGALAFGQTDVADSMVLLLSGEVHVRRNEGTAMMTFIGRSGQITGRLPYSRMASYGASGHVVGNVWALKVHESLFPEMLAAIPSMTQRCVTVLLDRVREVTRIEQQAEKLNALGKLAANLAHELNNPASAAQRSASSLFSELRQYGDQKYRMGNLCLSETVTAKYRNWVVNVRASMVEHSAHQPAVDILAASDHEMEIVHWLESHNIPNPWAIAPALAETGLPTKHLDELAEIMTAEALPVAVATVASSLRAERMAETVVNSTVRIFDLIRAIKDYSYMDQAPIQDIDLPQALENTLIMMKSRLHDVHVEMDFDPDLPPIAAYGREMNQVWTALIENSLDAMQDKGTLRLKTRRQGQMAYIEVWDSGPGISPELKSRIFEPFFTTKAPGCGLGLGLDTAQRIVQRHSGYINVESRPGATCFQVRIPLKQAGAY